MYQYSLAVKIYYTKITKKSIKNDKKNSADSHETN